MPPLNALVVLSGGQDSTLCLFWALQRWGSGNVAAITFNYNQRHAREIESAVAVAQLAKITSHEILDVGPILSGKSPLTNPDVPLEQYQSYDQMEAVIGTRVETTFVPMRNALFLTLAGNRAEVLDIDNIVTGVCQADNANYPDCRRSFIDMQEQTINHALGYVARSDGVVPLVTKRIHTPLMLLSKAQSVMLAVNTPGAYPALAWTHTAYDGSYPPTGKDHATLLRAHGFEEACVPDPLVLRAHSEGAMDLPDTVNYSPSALRTYAGLAGYP